MNLIGFRAIFVVDRGGPAAMMLVAIWGRESDRPSETDRPSLLDSINGVASSRSDGGPVGNHRHESEVQKRLQRVAIAIASRSRASDRTNGFCCLMIFSPKSVFGCLFVSPAANIAVAESLEVAQRARPVS